MEMDDEPVRDERPVGGRQALALHRTLDPALELDGLQARPEEAGGRALEEAFEEPLDGGEWRHGRSRSLPQGPSMPVRPRIRPLTFGAPRGVPTVEGRWRTVRYTLDPLGRLRRPGVVRANPGTR